jgi:alpha-tubulin suppressor-like RCC1 family protein
MCWGYDADGQLGNDSTTDSRIPALVLGLASDIVSIAAGPSHTCAMTSGGTKKCWGMGFGRVPVDVRGY